MENLTKYDILELIICHDFNNRAEYDNKDSNRAVARFSVKKLRSLQITK